MTDNKERKVIWKEFLKIDRQLLRQDADISRIKRKMEKIELKTSSMVSSMVQHFLREGKDYRICYICESFVLYENTFFITIDETDYTACCREHLVRIEERHLINWEELE